MQNFLECWLCVGPELMKTAVAKESRCRNMETADVPVNGGQFVENKM